MSKVFITYRKLWKECTCDFVARHFKPFEFHLFNNSIILIPSVDRLFFACRICNITYGLLSFDIQPYSYIIVFLLHF